MSEAAVYHTTVSWKGEHWGHVKMGNGPEMEFSAPPDAHGHAGVLTPEDAFVAAVNTCVMMMFIWAAGRFKLNLRAYSCRAEAGKVIALDRTECFGDIRLWPHIGVAGDGTSADAIETRVRKALRSAHKYSLVAQSIKPAVIIEPTIEIVD